MLQVIAVLLVAVGFGLFSGAVGAVRWGVAVGGLVLAVASLLLLVDVGGDD